MEPKVNRTLGRRAFLGRASMGLGSLGLAQLFRPDLYAAEPGVTGYPNRQAKIKRVIFLCMAGGPAHLELFDYKPELAKRDGEPMPESFTKNQQIAQLQGQELRVLGPQHPFKHYGTSGQHMVELLPHIGGIADDICIVRSMTTEQINHDTAHTFMNTGFRIPGRPSIGSWITYGLGSESEDLPGFRRTDVRGRSAGPAHCIAAVGGGLPPQQVPRSEIQLHGRSGQLRAQSSRRGPRDSGRPN